jgi:hypothetical protein
MMKNKNLCNWSTWVGAVGVLAFFTSFVSSLMGDVVAGLGAQQWYGIGSGLIMIAIWMSLGAIFYKGGGMGM